MAFRCELVRTGDRGRRRHVARRAARGRGRCAATGYDGAHRRDRRRAAPAVRPAAAVEGAARAATAEPDEIVLRKQGVDDLDARLAARARGGRRSTSRRATVDARRRRARRVRRPRASRPARRRAGSRTSPTSTACSRCARSTTRSRCASELDAAPEGRRDRRRVHRRRGRGDVPGARPRRDRARGAAAADGARARPELGAVIAGAAPRPRRRPAHRRRRRRDRGRRARSSACGSATARRSTPTSWSSASAWCPTTDWLEGSGLTLDNGVVCDETLLAAPGDRRRRRRRAAGRTRCSTASSMRLEHWTNATEQGVHAAQRLLAGDDGASRSRRCRSCGPTSTTARSSASGTSRGDDDVHDRARLARRAAVRRAVRSRRPPRRRARVQPAARRHAVPAHDRRAGVVGRRARARGGGDA